MSRHPWRGVDPRAAANRRGQTGRGQLSGYQARRAAPWPSVDDQWPSAEEGSSWAEEQRSSPDDRWVWSDESWPARDGSYSAQDNSGAAQDDSWLTRDDFRATRDDFRATRDGSWSTGDGAWSSQDDSWSQDDHWLTPEVPARAKRRGGRHRMPPPPSALKGRAAVLAVAAGAFVAAAQMASASTDKAATQSVETIALGQAQAAAPAPPSVEPGLLDEAPVDVAEFSDMLSNGSRVAEELSAQAEAKLRPLFVKFTSGILTSGFGARWGVLHGGVDVAAPIGTPIVAVEDGTVISAGPAEGFGMWVRVLGDDGTVTVYGHINTALVSVGERVMAGDEIATVGNRGESTGPHCHFEVWLNGTDRIDPLPWLATRGIGLGPERD